jgi:ABC-type antimicrobial peptide transport system permease subunit
VIGARWRIGVASGSDSVPRRTNVLGMRWSIGNLSDPVVLLAISLVLLLVTLTAAAIPASRAASIEPADALRID